jgi:hypothetical protein
MVRFPLPIAAIFVIVSVLCIAGCTQPGHRPTQDVVVIKLSPNGSEEWTGTIDSGIDDNAKTLIQGPGGDLLVAVESFVYNEPPGKPTAGDRFQMVRLSSRGVEVEEKNISPNCRIDSITTFRDGGFATAAFWGTICRYDPGENLVWTRDIDSLSDGDVISMTETSDGGLLAGGRSRMNVTTKDLLEHPEAVIAKLDRSGTISWQRSYGSQNFYSAFAITERTGSTGFLVGLSNRSAEAGGQPDSSFDRLFIGTMSENGSLLGVTPLGRSRYPSTINTLVPTITRFNGSVTALFNNCTFSGNTIESEDWVAAHLNADGTILGKRTLVAGTPVIIPTDDGGFFFAGFKNGNRFTGISRAMFNPQGTLHSVKIDAWGTVVWDREIYGLFDNRDGFEVVQAIQTNDGGYAILGTG